MAVKPELPSLADWMAAASAAVDALGQLTDDEINEAARRAGFDADASELATCSACPLAVGMSSVPVVGGTGEFPPSGALVIDLGEASEETVSYAGTTATAFVLTAPLTHDHNINCTVQLSTNGDL